MTQTNAFFSMPLSKTDPTLFQLMLQENKRQHDHIELIASENYVSQAVLDALGSPLTNKYAEGYPGKRYYGGCHCVDEVESLAIERACQLFDAHYANVQPHSGSQANQAVYLGLLKPGDKVMGLAMDAGGHLTHGSSVNLSGKWFEAISYGVDEKSALIDYDYVRDLATQHTPQIIIAGGSAYPRSIDFKAFRAIADEVGAYLWVDMAHFAGLVAAKLCENPLLYADVVTTTTHKTLRGPRGGMVLTNHEAIAKKINSAIFPGLQGGPLMHVIAAKAVAFGEALTPAFRTYSQQVLENAQAFGKALKDKGFDLVSGGTDTHLLLVDLRPKNITGKAVEESLEQVGIACNKNGIPFDPLGPRVTSGIRVGTPAMTTRGFGSQEFAHVADLMANVVTAIHPETLLPEATIAQIKDQVRSLCERYPLYGKIE